MTNPTNTSTQPTDEQRRQLIAALARTISAEQQAFNHAMWERAFAWNKEQIAKKQDKQETVVK